MEFEKEVAIKIEVDPAEEEDISSETSKGIVTEMDCLRCLKTSFGHLNFLDVQWTVIASILNDRRDNFVSMPACSGKSLCFQFPSVYLNTITIVVTPLISLMQDQVQDLRSHNLRACYINLSMTYQAKATEFAKVKDREYNIVYVTPEYIVSDVGRDLLKEVQNALTLIAIDEVYSVSKWGDDFRFSLGNLALLRQVCPTVPILALTGTGRPALRDHVIQSLGMRKPQIIFTSFDRPNLEFIIKPKSHVWQDISPYINSVKTGSIVVHCITKDCTESTAKIISENGIPCDAYHSGVPLDVREKIQEDFMQGRKRAICSTVAFGMGINKPDVRLVILYGASKDIESYYLKFGLAGRDGRPSKCVMFYSDTDWDQRRFLRGECEPAVEKLQESLLTIMQEFVCSKECRRRFILRYFEEKCDKLESRPDCCDICKANSIQKI